MRKPTVRWRIASFPCLIFVTAEGEWQKEDVAVRGRTVGQGMERRLSPQSDAEFSVRPSETDDGLRHGADTKD
jgi:hypothetical protein